MTESENPRASETAPHVTEFNHAIASIKAHNEEFSLGKAMAKAIFSHVKVEEDEPYAPNNDLSHQIPFDEEREMSSDILHLANAQTLSSIGLNITPVRKQATMYGPQGEQEIGPVRLQLVDGEKFSEFLTGIEPKDSDETLRENATRVIQSLLSELSDNIAYRGDGESVLEILATTEKLLAGLEHIGLGSSDVAKSLKSYSDHSKKGDLVEFVLGTRLQLFRKPEDQGFGPSKWQRDISAANLQQKWDEVIALLRKAKANRNGDEIFRELTRNAKQCLDIAKSYLPELRARSGEQYVQGFEGIFNEVTYRIHELEHK